MQLKQAQEILKPYGITILYDKTLKLYTVYFSTGHAYITEADMKGFDEPDFKTAVANALVKESVLGAGRQITIQ